MKEAKKKSRSTIRKLLDPRKIAVPVVIGLFVTAYFAYAEVEAEPFENLVFSSYSLLMIAFALIMVVLRDLGYILRLKILSGHQLSWKSLFQDIMLWEFSSAITPSVVGGSGVAIFILNKEGLKVGRSTAVVMVTAFLDELFYVIMVPLLFLFLGMDRLFPDNLPEQTVFGMTLGIKSVFWAGYAFMLFLISIIYYAIFVNPDQFKRLLITIFSLPFLRKWRTAAAETGDDLKVTSKELGSKPFSFWINAFMTTALSWTARYLVANFLLMAFTDLSFTDNLLVLARELIMWVIMLISPTPGGEGVAQLAFGSFLADFTPEGSSGILAVMWRLLTYYPYLLVGALVLPAWIQRVYLKRKLIKFKE